MEQKDVESIEKTLKALTAAVQELKSEDKDHTTVKVEETKTTETKHKHTLEEKDGKAFCTDCNNKYVSIDADHDSPSKIIDAVASAYHPKSKDFLSCPTCRKSVLEELDKTYDVKDKDGSITISKKKK